MFVFVKNANSMLVDNRLTIPVINWFLFCDIGVCVLCAITSVVALFYFKEYFKMVKCKIKACLHNKDNICTLESIEINSIYMCDNAKFEQSDNIFMTSSAEESYMHRKNMLIF